MRRRARPSPGPPANALHRCHPRIPAAPSPSTARWCRPCLFLGTRRQLHLAMDRTTCSMPSSPRRARPVPMPPTRSWSSATSLGLSWRLGALEELERKDAREIGLRVLVGRRVATTSTNRADRATLRGHGRGRGGRRPAAAGGPLGRPGGAGRARPRLARPRPRRPGRALAGQSAGRGRRRRGCRPRRAGRHQFRRRARPPGRASRVTLAASNGFRGSLPAHPPRPRRHRAGRHRHGMQRDYEYRQATHRADLPAPESIGRVAGERAARRVDPRKVATTRVPVVYEPRAAAGLLRHLASAIGGEAVAAGRSFLKDRLGQPVFAPGITIIDDPLRRRGLASRPFDGEGIAGRPAQAGRRRRAHHLAARPRQRAPARARQHRPCQPLRCGARQPVGDQPDAGARALAARGADGRHRPGLLRHRADGHGRQHRDRRLQPRRLRLLDRERRARLPGERGHDRRQPRRDVRRLVPARTSRSAAAPTRRPCGSTA